MMFGYAIMDLETTGTEFGFVLAEDEKQALEFVEGTLDLDLVQDKVDIQILPAKTLIKEQYKGICIAKTI